MSENENKNNDIKFEDLTDNYTYQESNGQNQQQNNGSYQQPIWSNNPQPEKPSNNAYCIASLVCGIISIVCCCINYFPIALGVLAIVFFVLAKKKGPVNGMATAGLVCGIVGLVIALVVTVMSFAMADFLDEFQSMLDSTLNV